MMYVPNGPVARPKQYYFTYYRLYVKWRDGHEDEWIKFRSEDQNRHCHMEQVGGCDNLLLFSWKCKNNL